MKIVALIAVLFWVCVRASAAGLDVEKGSVDLSKSEPFSRSFTIFDQLLYSLERDAIETAKDFRPEKNDFTLSRIHIPDARVSYEIKLSRVGVVLSVTASGMSSRWREVCERRIRGVAMDLGILGLGSQAAHPNPEIKDASIRVFFSRHLGPSASVEAVPNASLQPFLDAVVLVITFSVERPDKKGLAHLRQCALDTKTDRVKYHEHKY